MVGTIHNEFVTVYLEDRVVEFSTKDFPDDILEGDYIKINISLDPEAKKLAEAEDLDVGGILKDQKLFYGKFRDEF